MVEANIPLTLDDLGTWTRPGPTVGVLGHPIRHSLSPAMHNAALKSLSGKDSRFSSWSYFAFDVPPTQLAEALPRFIERGFRGLNLTIPHKVDVVPLLTSVDSLAARMGAVNTLIIDPVTQGIHGVNTDGYGISRAVQDELGTSLRGRCVILLGAGGAARAIAVQCLSEGCAELWIGNRSTSRLESLIALVSGAFPEAADRIRGFSLDRPPELFEPALVINATALGLQADDPSPVSLEYFPEGTRIYDTTYGVPNALRAAAGRGGFRYADGLAMLVWQGARSLELWTGAEPPVERMAEAARAALHARASS